nr:MAG TPA: hypothetical protein [Caudoviricetes sp.]
MSIKTIFYFIDKFRPINKPSNLLISLIYLRNNCLLNQLFL